MRRLLRAFAAREELPHKRRDQNHWPATMDPLFRHLRRHCRSTEALADDGPRLSVHAARRVCAKVVDSNTPPDSH